MKKVKQKIKDKKDCHYFYPFWEKNPNICWFKNQPDIEDECTGVECGHYTEGYRVRSISSMDSCRMQRPDSHIMV